MQLCPPTIPCGQPWNQTWSCGVRDQWLPESWHDLVIVSQKLQTLGERITWFHIGHPHIMAIGIFETWAVYTVAYAALCTLMHHKWRMYSSVNIAWYTYDFLPFVQVHSIWTNLWLGKSIWCSWSVLFPVLLMKLIRGGRQQSLRSISDVLFTLLNLNFPVILKKD